jgi:predicted nucleic acid-binding protein
MKYVLDASVAAYWVLRNPLQAKALKLRAEYQQNIQELIAPAHFRGEIASAFTKAERQKLIPVGDARRLIADVLSTPPVLYPLDPLFYRAVDISSQTRTGFYDCLYVALAEQENCELVTADDKLINALQGQFSFILSLASLP